MKTILVLLFLVFSQVGFAQLIDPFGKIITHEIKLEKLENGTYAGAIEWTSGGTDSIQKFIIKGLSVKAPVLVRIITKAPDHNIDLSFHKKNWDKVESKISTGKNKFVEKTFRTMNTAGLGVSSKVAGIPYLITVKVGLQFPSTKSIIRITDNKEEYTQHMRKMGYTGQLFADDNNSSSSNAIKNNSKEDNNTLIYIVIALLIIIIILLALFLLKRKSSKNTALLFLILCSAQFCMAQSSQPKLVPIDGQGNSPVFYEYRTSNVGNQVPVNTIMNIGQADIVVAGDNSLETRLLRLDTAPGVIELTGAEAAEVLRRIKEANELFDSNYGENSPGEDTEGDQRTLPPDINNEELDRLRRQVQRLQREVDLLSQQDEELGQNDNNNEDEILIYCEDRLSCRDCNLKWSRKIQITDSYFQFLQNFYATEIKDINEKIAFGNAWSNVHGVSAIAWQGILHKNIMPAVRQLKSAYSMKFDEYIQTMRDNFERMEQCNSSENPNGIQIDALKAQVKAKIDYYSRTKIID